MNAKSKNSTLADLKIINVFSGGQDVPDGGAIFSARANFTVTGPGDASLQLLIDDVPKYNGQTNNAGDLSFLIDDLPDGRHEYRLAHEEERTDPFTLNAVATKPFIETLKDSNGNVENGGSTEETELKINGLWKEGQIWILNGAAAEPIAMFRVGSDRTWGGDLTLATGKIHTLKARADDRSVSDLYTVTVGEVSEGEVKITSLKDSKGQDVASGGTTADTQLTISGSAKDGEVKLLEGDNTTPIETFTAADGTWGGEIELTAGNTYVLKAEDVDGEKSETHTVTVSEASEGEVKITSLKDSKGQDVASGGTTADTQLTISGSAKDGEIKLLEGDNTTPVETFTAANDVWGGTFELTAGKTYALKAVAEDGEESAVYTVTVSEAPEVELEITSLKDSKGDDVADGAVTDNTTLTIGGTAKDGEIELLEGDNTTPVETFTAENGVWGGTFVLAAGATYELKAKAEDDAESETYTVTVNAAPPETRVKH
jgi:translation initiation factor 1 (eIF-1/SUI1)